MNKIITFTILLLALTACTAPWVQVSESTGTDMSPLNMSNPASVYCEEQGNTLEIQTAEDASQSGVCIFPDGSSCDEWAYFRGECGSASQDSPTAAVTDQATPEGSGGGPGGGGDTEANDASGGYMAPGTSEEIADWWGVIKSTETGAQYDDYFERQDLGQIIYFGIESLDPAVQTQIEALRDSGKIVHLYGKLLSNVPDFNGSQVQVDRIEVEEQDAGSFMPPVEIVDWWGSIKSTQSGAQYDDYFERQDFVEIIYFGIDSMDPAVKSKIEALRDSGKIVHLYGKLLSNVPDYNGSQVLVDRIEVEG